MLVILSVACFSFIFVNLIKEASLVSKGSGALNPLRADAKRPRLLKRCRHLTAFLPQYTSSSILYTISWISWPTIFHYSIIAHFCYTVSYLPGLVDSSTSWSEGPDLHGLNLNQRKKESRTINLSSVIFNKSQISVRECGVRPSHPF